MTLLYQFLTIMSDETTLTHKLRLLAIQTDRRYYQLHDKHRENVLRKTTTNRSITVAIHVAQATGCGHYRYLQMEASVIAAITVFNWQRNQYLGG
jgi:UDP-galactopyranose mutase